MNLKSIKKKGVQRQHIIIIYMDLIPRVGGRVLEGLREKNGFTREEKILS